jgi:hypothetical protein
MNFDRKKFFDGLRAWEGPLSSQQVAGLNFILDAAEQDRYVTRIEWLAYMLATTKHETADTYQPIHEYGGRSYFIRRYGSQTAVGRRLGNDTPEEGALYAGQGLVQLTGETNYEKAEAALRREYPEIVRDFEQRTGRRFDLTVGDQPNDINDPKNAQDPVIAYAIMSYGMRTGMFTSRSLAHYTSANDFDELSARRIINGTDKAELIAGYFRRFLKILRNALISSEFTGMSGLVEHGTASATAIEDGNHSPTAVDETTYEQPSTTPQRTAEPLPTNGDASVQIAENIVNTGNPAPAEFVPETIDVNAPAPEGATATTARTTILGFAVPAGLYAVFEGAKQLVTDGVLDMKEIFNALLVLIRENASYLPYLVGFIVGIVALKKVFRQISFIVQMVINANPRWNNVNIVPTVKEPEPAWWQFWK